MSWWDKPEANEKPVQPFWSERSCRGRVVHELNEFRALHAAGVDITEYATDFWFVIANGITKLDKGTKEDGLRVAATNDLLQKIWEEQLNNEYKDLKQQLWQRSG
ncbi:MAG: hypothetical protein K2X93_23040 [Candidatus Obscuribacterales bacterium]|nr:hypothetical protein [Candidatus Obscuribacterales bacterium]